MVLAHGAGAPMDSEFLERMAGELAALEVRVVRFEFPYMAERRRTGKKRPPNSQNLLMSCWREVVAALGTAGQLVIGGKSMGGRIASMVADELGVRGLACLGYPFHPPGNPQKLRTAHLENLQTRTLIVQGERDSLGKPDEVETYPLSANIRLLWMPDGDHSLKPRKSSGRTEEENLVAAAAALAAFVHGL
ncbi:MAG: alpha/beta family hydrolase [Planctomycetota bacterium]